MPKHFSKAVKSRPVVAYPPGCKELTHELNKDELVKRLKCLARAFQEMGQEETTYGNLAIYLASDFFLDHTSKDVRLLVACCVADVFRIFAPEAPYNEPGHLKEIFLFLVKQLRGLEDPEAPSFKRYFYLLENLAWVKSFNICIELEDNQEIFCNLYKLMFSIVNEKHSTKVKNFMLDMMCPLITEADSVSQELLDIILLNIIEPQKSENHQAYNLAKDLIKRTSNAIEPYIQTFFNNALMLGKTSESELSNYIFKLIYELNTISPSVLLAVLPQLEFKLKSNDVDERRQVSKLLAKMFSDKDSDLATQNKPLWNCFIGRFNDIDVSVREVCVKSAENFLVNHPPLQKDISEALKSRIHDIDENIRSEAVGVIVSAAKQDISTINEDLVICLKDRTLDKKFKIRREALLGLGQVYKKIMATDSPLANKLGWVKDKILHAYYQQNVDDRLIVERVFNTCLTPYNLKPKERMTALFKLFATLDERSTKAFNEMLRTQFNARQNVSQLLELHSKDLTDEVVAKNMNIKILQLLRHLPDGGKQREALTKFNKIIHDDSRIRLLMKNLVQPHFMCKKAEEHVNEILKKLGSNPTLYNVAKVLLERIAPVLIDQEAIKALVELVQEAVDGIDSCVKDVDRPGEIGMKLLLTLSFVFPGSFHSVEVYETLLTLLKHEDDVIPDIALQIFTNAGQDLQENFSNVFSSLLPVLQSVIKIGTPKQAKHAVKCIEVLCTNKSAIYEQVFEYLKKSLTHESANLITALVSLGHIAQICPAEFGAQMKAIVTKVIVKEILMQDLAQNRNCKEKWLPEHRVSDETQAKVQSMKMMVRWLLGLRSNATNCGSSTLRLLFTCIKNDGDLMEKGLICEAEKARLRLTAGCCVLKIAQDTSYTESLTNEQFQTAALLINDRNYEVRSQFAEKLHKGLMSLKLPLQFLSIFSLVGLEPMKEKRLHLKQCLVANITQRKAYLRRNPAAHNKIYSILPEYTMPYVVHLLSHDPEYKQYNDTESLTQIKDCLWFILEPLLAKMETDNYNFFKKMFENIKQTKDAQCPDVEDANKKLYAVCDLAMGLVLSKCTTTTMKDHPVDPVLPAQLFTQVNKKYTNTKIYLPKEFEFLSPRRGKTGVSSMQMVSPPTKAPISPMSASSSPPMSPDAAPKKTQKSTLTQSKRSASEENEPKAAKPDSTKRSKPKDSEDTENVVQNSPKKATKKRKTAQTEVKKSDKSDSKKKDVKSKSKTKMKSPPSGNKSITDYMKPKEKDTKSVTKTSDKDSKNPQRNGLDKDKKLKNKAVPQSSSRETRSTPTKRRPGDSQVTSPRRAAASSPSGSPVGSRKRSASSTPEESPAKRGRPSPVKPTRGAAVRNLAKEVAKAKKTLAKSPRNFTQKSPTSSPAKSTRSSSSSSPRKVKEQTKKNYHMRNKANVRRAPVANGTSDGEDQETPDNDTPLSPSPRKAAALAKAIETVGTESGDELNVKRKRSKRLKR
ncbi:unnamed protein product [Owenia fusiformis]|uniref:Uncharacterized protein n=1 Tax=Owenia fusiformis TaxID=6347 RepID=A0A8J1TIS4_OWEFU|nr:unnamed protein product [Owenia fusiformis]